MCDTGDCVGCRYTSHAGAYAMSRSSEEVAPKESGAQKVVDDTPAHLQDWLDELVSECVAVMRERGRKYGPGNIAEWGELGVLVRLSDKMARLREMQKHVASDFLDESVEDTYIDIINYGIIALAWRRGLWPGSEKKN